MKPISGKIFLDSNILVYSYSNTEIDKQLIARKLISIGNTFISTQVLQELCNVITRKFKFSYQVALAVIDECATNNTIYVNRSETIIQACIIADRYKFSFYDSLIIAAAIECGCSTLYSEEMHHQLVVDNKLTIINPFT